ncbi:MAG: GrpE protein [Dehalococcoidia bacterium]|nr:GrpE protein [Dehalococcoidia bacterium]
MNTSYSNWQRTAADFANFKRRTEQERSDAARFASSMLILTLLPIVDDFERALGNVPRELAGLTWIDGMQLIYRKLLAILENQGVAALEAVGQPFDPNLHEAVMRSPGEEGKVLSELQRGYTLQGRVIRQRRIYCSRGEL